MAEQDPYAAIAHPVATPTGVPDDTYRTELARLVNSGASRAQIEDYLKSVGYTPDQVHGLEAALDYKAKGGKGLVSVRPSLLVTPQAQQPPAPENDPYAAFADLVPQDAQHGALDQLGIGARAVGKGLGSLLDFGFLPAELVLGLDDPSVLGMYSQDADKAADALGLARPQSDAENLASKTIEGATGALATGGLGALGAKALAGTAAGRVAESLAQAPVAQAIAGGAAGGASELARQSGAGPAGQLIAGLAGGLGAGGAIAGGGKLADSVASTMSNERTLTPVAQAFERQGVPALAADVGGTGVRMATGAANTTLGGLPLRAAAEKSIEMARAARDRIAAQIGRVGADQTAGGNAAQAGARKFLASTEQRGGQLYDAIPIAADTQANLSNSKQALSEITSGLSSNPELSAVISDPRMQRIADAIQGKVVQEPTGLLDASGAPIMRDVQKGGNLSWQDLKEFRTYIGEKAGAQALQSDIPQAKLKALYGALSSDMRATAEAQGPKALAAFNRANAYWRAREARIENVVTPILGKDLNKTPEEAFRQIERWAGDKGSFVRTAQALRTMPQDEADSIRATVFSRLGNAPAGGQNGAGEVFSPATFMTQWNRMPPNAKAVLFPGKEYQQDIADIVSIAEAQKAAGKFANTSHTATAMHMAPGVGTTVALFHNPIALLGAAGSQFAIGKLLASPKFARWLASAPNKPNAAAQLAHVNRLASISAAQPAIANDVLALQERLAKAFAGQPLAAEEQGQ